MKVYAESLKSSRKLQVFVVVFTFGTILWGGMAYWIDSEASNAVTFSDWFEMAKWLVLLYFGSNVGEHATKAYRDKEKTTFN